MTEREAFELICEIAESWAGEYGFSNPDAATRVLDAVELLESAQVDQRLLDS